MTYLLIVLALAIGFALGRWLEGRQQNDRIEADVARILRLREYQGTRR